MTPNFKDYLQKSDIAGYMKALWKNARENDLGSLHALLYLAVQCKDPDTIMMCIKALCDLDDEFATFLTDFVFAQAEKLPKEEQEDDDKLIDLFKVSYPFAEKQFPDHPNYVEIYGRNHNDLLRAYLNDIGKEEEEELPDATGVVANPNVEVPADLLDDWKRYYTRTDASSTQMAIYQAAIPYAKQGHPFSMFLVGSRLYKGIRTSYSTPSVVYLEPNTEAALPWLVKAAEAGVEEAYKYLLQIYTDLKDQAKLDEWIEKGVALNIEASIRMLFEKYEKAEEWDKAFPLLIKLTTEFHDRTLRLELAKWYREGKGCPKDDKKAFEQVEYVYKHSSVTPYDDDHDNAAEELARYYDYGIGCEKDEDKAADIRHQLKSDWDDLEEVLTR